jgi:hypothetical protein
MQVEVPIMMGGAERDRMRKRTTWIKSLAAFMASQPASHQIHLNMFSTDLPATQALAPWITTLSIVLSQEEDIGQILKGIIEVRQAP